MVFGKKIKKTIMAGLADAIAVPKAPQPSIVIFTLLSPIFLQF